MPLRKVQTRVNALKPQGIPGLMLSNLREYPGLISQDLRYNPGLISQDLRYNPGYWSLPQWLFPG